MDLNNKVYVPEYPGNYPEDFEWENGEYIHQCRECGNKFCGHKYRRTCKVCLEEHNKKKEIKMKYLISFNDNWGDEMDVCGWGIYTEEEKNEYLESVSNYFKENGYCSIYVGSNQEIEYEDEKEFLNTLEIKEITDEEEKTIKKIFGCSYGKTPSEVAMYME